MIELLMFLIVETHPDIAIAILVMSRYAKNLSLLYTKFVKTIMQYLKVICTLNIIYGEDKKNLIIREISNFNWAKNHALRKSTLRFIFMLHRSLIS